MRHAADRGVGRPELFPPGSISIYKHASGSPTVYVPPKFAVVYYLGYDSKGTLYLDGTDGGSSFLFDSSKDTTFKSIVLEHSIGGPGAVEAVGNDIVHYGSAADRFKYPAGGAPTKSAPGLSQPIGAVISK